MASLLQPRDGIVREAAAVEAEPGTWRFDLAEGPVANYQRLVRVGSGAPGGVPVEQEVRFRIGIPLFSWLFAGLLRSYLGGLGQDGRPGRKPPWWAPPGRLSHPAAVALSGLCGFAVLAGYLDSLLPSTVTYVGREYHVGDAGQGYALAAVQAGAVAALGLLAVADRRGRRRSVLAATVAGSAVTALGALAPSLATVALTQFAALALLTAQYVLLGVLVVELMPAGARAWALALVTMSYGLGGGFTLLALPLADLGPDGWRWTYAVAALAVPAAWPLARWVPESPRWERDVGRRGGTSPPADGRRPRWTAARRRRLALLGAGALLFALFDTPAGQFQNQYFRVQRHWSALHISVAEQIVGTVGGLGTLVGGRLADTHGRRPVAAVAVALGTAVTVLEYVSRGTPLYVWMSASSLLGYAAAPALAVYGGELFPTALRGRAGGAINVLAAAGGLVGLAATGALGGSFGRLGPALAVVAAGPIVLVALIVAFYPETAGRALEELNPADAAAVTPAP